MDADSVNPITSYLCDTCGSTVYRRTPFFPGLTILKAGMVDGEEGTAEAEGVTMKGMAEAKPAHELWVGNRAAWVPKVEGSIESLGQEALVQ